MPTLYPSEITPTWWGTENACELTVLRSQGVNDRHDYSIYSTD